MDVRAPGDSPKAIIKKARPALLRVIAAVSGCPYGQLVRQHKIRQISQTAAKRLSLAAVAALVFAGSVTLWASANAYREEARREQTASMAMLSELTYGLPNNLAELPGTYGRVAGLLEENAGQIIRILNLAVDKAAVMPEIAANYEKLATASIRLGRYTQAEAAQEEAIALYETLLLGPESDSQPTRQIASAFNNLGSVYSAGGTYEKA